MLVASINNRKLAGSATLGWLFVSSLVGWVGGENCLRRRASKLDQTHRLQTEALLVDGEQSQVELKSELKGKGSRDSEQLLAAVVSTTLGTLIIASRVHQLYVSSLRAKWLESLGSSELARHDDPSLAFKRELIPSIRLEIAREPTKRRVDEIKSYISLFWLSFVAICSYDG